MQKLNKGISLITIIFIIVVLLILGVGLSRVVLNSLYVSNNKIAELQAFYLAEAGVEKIKYELKKNPNWYTDLPHAPIDDTKWLMGKSIVRGQNKLRAYAVGKSKESIRIIKIEFELSPFKQKSWKLF